MNEWTRFTVRWNLGKNAWKHGSNERWSEVDIPAPSLDTLLAWVQSGKNMPHGANKDTVRSILDGEDFVWRRPIRMTEVVAEHDAADEKAARKAQKWLREQLALWLKDNPKLEWIKVVVSQDEDCDDVTRIEVTSRTEGHEEPGDEYDLATAIQEYGYYLHLGMPWGAWVTMMRDGKVHKTSAKRVEQLREEEKG